MGEHRQLSKASSAGASAFYFPFLSSVFRSIIVDETCCDDQKSRKRVPDVLVQDHELHQCGALRDVRDRSLRYECRIQNPTSRRVREHGGDDESCRGEAEKARVDDGENASCIFFVGHIDATPRHEDDDTDGEDEYFPKRDDAWICRHADRTEHLFRISDEATHDIADALRGDDADVARDDDSYGLVLPDDEAVAHHDREEDDDEQIPAER